MKKSYLILFLGLFSGCFVVCFESCDTLNGQKVTKENICTFAEKAPRALHACVIKLFSENPKLYELLVHQDFFLIDFIDFSSQGKCLVESQFESLQNMNYVFKIPDKNFLIKICSPINRFRPSAINSQLGSKNKYMRAIEQKIDGKTLGRLQYMDFQEDRERIRKYFYVCVPNWFLMQIPSKKQLKELVTLIASSMPKAMIRKIISYKLLEKYIKKDPGIIYNSIEDAFNEFLEYTFGLLPECCYNKLDIIGKKFCDTYSLVGRIFHYLRFKEAIKKFKLYRLEEPPKSYLVNVNSERPDSISDKDVVFVQEILQNHHPLHFYLKEQEELDKILDKEAFGQFLVALKYAGIWDASERNIFINKDTKKITYIDFEHYRDVAECELFNKSKLRLQKNLYEACARLLKILPEESEQEKTLIRFMRKKNRDLDFMQYIKDRRKEDAQKNKRVHVGPLGRLLYFEHPESSQCFELRKAVFNKLLKSI